MSSYVEVARETVDRFIREETSLEQATDALWEAVHEGGMGREEFNALVSNIVEEEYNRGFDRACRNY